MGSTGERPKIEDYPYTDINLLLSPVQPNMIIKCDDRIWHCHKEILSPRCSFFEVCCYSGFEESETCKIKLVDDNPDAIDALLRYFYTLDCTQIFSQGHHIFADIELDLDIFLAADKYEALSLRDYMGSKIRLFYDVLQRPQNKMRTWNGYNQGAFGRVLRKLYTLEEETTIETAAIRRSVAHFITSRERTVLQWPEVITAMEDYAELSNDLISYLLGSRKILKSRVDQLEQEVLDLSERVEELEDANEEQLGELETYMALANADEHWDAFDWANDQEMNYDYGQ